MRDFRLPLRCQRNLRSSGILHSQKWQFLAELWNNLLFPPSRVQSIYRVTRNDSQSFNNLSYTIHLR